MNTLQVLAQPTGVAAATLPVALAVGIRIMEVRRLRALKNAEVASVRQARAAIDLRYCQLLESLQYWEARASLQHRTVFMSNLCSRKHKEAYARYLNWLSDHPDYEPLESDVIWVRERTTS